MKVLESKKYKIIYDKSASGFEKKLNDAIEQLNDHALEVNITEQHQNGVLAYIKYSNDVKIPESIADELELRGLQIKCADCPYIQKTDDQRKKKFPCKYASYGSTFLDSPACNRFYEELIQMFYEYKINASYNRDEIELHHAALLKEK